MIEKLKVTRDNKVLDPATLPAKRTVNFSMGAVNKINQVIDAVNKFDKLLDALVVNTNIHEREIDKLQMANIHAITNDYTVIKYDELCRLREAADELARLKGLKGFQN